MAILPDDDIEKKNGYNTTIICLPYDKKQIYSFMCARYENISYEEFMNMGYQEYLMKISSVPESEPLYNIIKSRTIKLSSIKNKDEKKYWGELKEKNKIPAIYLPTEELDRELKESIKERGFKNVK